MEVWEWRVCVSDPGDKFYIWSGGKMLIAFIFCIAALIRQHFALAH